MKKTLIALAMSIATIATIAAPSFAAEDTEITFRSIPWGTTKAEIISEFSDVEFINVSTPDVESPLETTDSIYSLCKPTSYYVDGEHADLSIDMSKHAQSGGSILRNFGDITVAGYTSWTTALFFIQPINEDNTINHNVDDSTLYLASYYLTNGSVNQEYTLEDIYNDLYNKLNTLYADCTYQQNLAWCGPEHVWTDADGNSVSLCLEYAGSAHYYGIYIIYQSGTAITDLAILNALLTVEDAAAQKEFSSNSEGL